MADKEISDVRKRQNANLVNWKKGQSGNPAGQSRERHRIAMLCRPFTEKGVKAMNKIMLDTKERASTRILAFNALMDRAWGRAKQTITIDNTENMSDAELEAIIAEKKEYLATLEAGVTRACGGGGSAGASEADGGGTGGSGTVH